MLEGTQSYVWVLFGCIQILTIVSVNILFCTVFKFYLVLKANISYLLTLVCSVCGISYFPHRFKKDEDRGERAVCASCVMTITMENYPGIWCRLSCILKLWNEQHERYLIFNFLTYTFFVNKIMKSYENLKITF